jgi:hypothetical protein
MVSPYVVHHKINGFDFDTYFNSRSLYKIISKAITYYPRTEIEAIRLIPKTKISDIKRKLLLNISRNGCFENYRNLYAINLRKKMLYIGLRDMDDSHIIEYQNTNSIIFSYTTIH